MPATLTARKTGKPLSPVTPEVTLDEYDVVTGTGLIRIDGKQYLLVAHRADGRTVGMRLSRLGDSTDGKATMKRIDIDFTGDHGWGCDCEDATYRPNRPGGCKHLVSMRKARELMRCEQAGK